MSVCLRLNSVSTEDTAYQCPIAYPSKADINKKYSAAIADSQGPGHKEQIVLKHQY